MRNRHWQTDAERIEAHRAFFAQLIAARAGVPPDGELGGIAPAAGKQVGIGFHREGFPRVDAESGNQERQNEDRDAPMQAEGDELVDHRVDSW